jgi:hypothetical protein
MIEYITPHMDATKLQLGSRIRVIGLVMLKGLDEGDYEVVSTQPYGNIPAYTFTKVRGKKWVRFAVNQIDPWIRPAGHPDNNRIEVIE